MNGDTHFLGIVQNGKFEQVMPAPDTEDPARFTSIQMQEARSPESGELDLSPYEGMAIMISAHGESGWVHSAQVIDTAGPILTEVVKYIFSKE
jgi:hypothetical protein